MSMLHFLARTSGCRLQPVILALANSFNTIEILQFVFLLQENKELNHDCV